MRNIRIKIWVLLSAIIMLLITQSTKSQITGFEAARQMRGINIGNTLDAPPGETSWGNPLIQDYYFDDYKAAGFTAIRVCVTWQEHMMATAPYTVEKAFMDRVEQVCDWGLARGLFIVVNSMHDGFIKNNYDQENKNRFDALWQQISDRFKSKSDHLVFEILNESNPIGQSNAVDLNTRICNLIRNSGGKNSTRIIIYAGEGCSIDQLVNATPVPLADHTYLIGNFHLYTPWGFVCNDIKSWGSSSDWASINGDFNRVATYSKTNNVAVMVNEFGCGPGRDWNSRMDFYTVHVLNSLNNGFGYFAWDNNGDFKTYDRQNRKWIEDVKDVLTNPAVSASGCKADAWMQASGVSRMPFVDGYYVGDIHTGDYMNYKIDIPVTGNYKFEARVASPNTGARMSIEKTGGALTYGIVDVTNTGDWQKWAIVSKTIPLTAGRLDFSIGAATGGFNLDWFKLTLDVTPVSVTSVSFAQSSQNVSLNTNVQLSAIVAPSDATNKSLIWTSDNSGVATVDDNGIVTGKTVGTAIITAKTVDGGFKATITITVNNQSVTGLTLSPATLSLFATNTSQLTATISPANASNKTVIYSCNKHSIASVSASGLVTGISPGTAIITATTVDGGFISSSTVVVKAIPPFNLKIEAESHDQMSGITDEACTEGGQDVGFVDVGDWIAFSNKTVPATAVYTVNFRVSSPNSNGKLRFDKDGGTTVFGEVSIPNTGGWQNWKTVTTTFSMPAGTYNLGINFLSAGININWIEITAESKISNRVTGISLDNSASVSLSKTILLNPIFSPIDATNKAIMWTSSDNTIATVDTSGVVTGKGKGVAKIFAQTEDGDFVASCSVTVLDAITNMSENDKQEGILIYPNPASSSILIDGLNSSSIQSIEILDLTGKQVFLIPIAQYSGSIDVSLFPDGVYLVKITTDKGVLTEKIVKQLNK